MNDLIIQPILLRMLGRWWLILIFSILGGIGGWLFSDLQPPLYEAQARFHLFIDLAQTGRMDPLDVDFNTQTAGWVMSDEAVLQEVIKQAASQGIQIDSQKTKVIFTHEQFGETWYLRVRYSDPQTAAILANLWADIGYQTLSAVLIHAEQAEGYRRYLEALQSCLMQAYINEPASAQCIPDNIEAIQNDLAATGQLYRQEKAAARGVIPAITLSLESRAALPEIPVRYDRGILILVGALIGLFVGGWAVGAGLADRTRGK